MKKDWDTVDILKHSRHDWLNKIQLIKGNLALNRTDRVKEIIDEIVIETQHESNLTNLKLRSLAALLMTYNWEQHKFQLEYEVLGDIKNLSAYDKALTECCITFFANLEEVIDSYGENHLSLSIESFHDEVRFFFDFSGTIKDKEQLIRWFERKMEHDQSIRFIEHHVHSEEMTAVIRIM